MYMEKRMYYYIIMLWNKIIYFIKDIFYFNICSYCKKKIDNKDKRYLSLCQDCINSVSYLAPIKHKKTSFLVYSLGKYDGVLRYIVTEKYRKRSLNYDVLENKIIAMINIFKIDFDYILPIPKTAINKLKHQVNQTAIIAEMIKDNYKKDIFEFAYTRQKKQDQAGKKNSERVLMNQDSFFIPDSKKMLLSKKKILIIDDVYTTGTTIDSILHAISKIDYTAITILVLARK